MNERVIPRAWWVNELVAERSDLAQIYTPLTIGIVLFRSNYCGSSCTQFHRSKHYRQQMFSPVGIQYTDRIQQIVLPDGFLGSSTETTNVPKRVTTLYDKQRQNLMRNNDSAV